MKGWDVAFAEPCELAERPLWDDRTGSVVWVDIHAGVVHRLGGDGGHSSLAVGAPLGAAALRAGGGLVLARGGGVAFRDPDGVEDRPEVAFGLEPGMRFNDGACDPAGRFLVGTCSGDGAAGRGALYSLSPDGGVRELLGGVTESNGIAWSPDGGTMYYVDSGDPRVCAFDYDPAAGSIAGRRELVALGEGEGIPDGLVVDADGAVWVALWEGWAVRRYSPEGSLLAHLETPVSRPTCPAFGGPALDRLYVATAWEGMSAAERADELLAGAILVTVPGVRGLPALRFAG